MYLTFRIVLIFYAGLCQLSAQTQIDLKTQTRRVDFSAATTTKPMKSGIALPTTCETGEVFYKTNAVAGANIYGCVSTNMWSTQSVPAPQGQTGAVLTTDGVISDWIPLGGDVSGVPAAVKVEKLQNHTVAATVPQNGQALMWDGSAWRPQTIGVTNGALTMETNGTIVGTRAVQNLIPGVGLLNLVTDTGSKLNVQSYLDSAVVLTRSGHQSGATLLCSSTSNSATNYTCAMTPTLTSYLTGMVVYWQPNLNAAGGQTTLAIDTLDAKPVKLPDGLEDPQEGDLRMTELYPLWYDGTVFRLFTVREVRSSTRPPCSVALRGRLWFQAAADGSADEFTVCAKDATNAYGWRGL